MPSLAPNILLQRICNTDPSPTFMLFMNFMNKFFIIFFFLYFFTLSFNQLNLVFSLFDHKNKNFCNETNLKHVLCIIFLGQLTSVLKKITPNKKTENEVLVVFFWYLHFIFLCFTNYRLTPCFFCFI